MTLRSRSFACSFVALLLLSSGCAPRLASRAKPAPRPAAERAGEVAGLGLASELRAGLSCDVGTVAAVRPHPEGMVRCCVDALGRRHGAWFLYSRDGIRLMERRYREDKKHGPARGWFENGQVHAVGSYENDQRQGLWRFWNDTGLLQREILYRAGEKLEEHKVAPR